MKTILHKITLILLLFIMCNAVFAQHNLLYVGRTDNPVDSAMMAYLDMEGFNITLIDASEFSGSDYKIAAPYLVYDAIFISETISSSQTVNFKEAGFPIPCVTTEGYAIRSDRWGFLTNDDTQFKQLSGDARTPGTFTMVIHDVDHWIAERYTPDYHLRWTSLHDSLASTIGVTSFDLEPTVFDAVSLGHFLSDSLEGLSSIFAIPHGATIASDPNVTLPNMVIIGVVAKGIGTLATDEFNQLVLYSLKWVVEDLEIESVSNNSQQYNLKAWPNPTIGILNLSFTLPISGNVKVNIYDIAGKFVETINSGYLTAGYNTIKLDFSGMAKAQYIYEIITEDDILRGKVIY